MNRLRQRFPKGTWMRLHSPATLKAMMDRRGFSMDRLARYSGCSKGFISHLLAGRRHSCTPALAQNIAEALDVPLDVLFLTSSSVGDGVPEGRGRRVVAA